MPPVMSGTSAERPYAGAVFNVFDRSSDWARPAVPSLRLVDQEVGVVIVGDQVEA